MTSSHSKTTESAIFDLFLLRSQFILYRLKYQNKTYLLLNRFHDQGITFFVKLKCASDIILVIAKQAIFPFFLLIF
jgi:hypothetical protein